MRTTIMTIAPILLGVMIGSLWAQELKVDTRINNIIYWNEMVKQGLAPVNPHKEVSLGKYTGSRINSRLVQFEDSEDMPVNPGTDNTQSEISVFIHPDDNNIAFNSNNSTPWPVSFLYGTSYFITHDGGASFVGSVEGTGGSNSGDPATSIGLNGRFYNGFIGSGFSQGVAWSDDLGVTWSTTTIASGGSLDKNHLWVDNSPTSPYQGNVYAAWTGFYSTPDNNIEIMRSTDNGLTWQDRINVSAATNPGSHDQGVNIETGPNGEVYVAYTIYDCWPCDETAMGLARSFDGGATYEPAVRIIENIRGIRTTETSKDQRVSSYPVLTCDLSNGPRRGWLYMVWPNIGYPGENDGPEIDIYMVRSEDGGDTWSEPTRVNQDPPNMGKEHYYAWIACDPETGDLACIFYDDRNVSSTEAETFLAVSSDGGDTWEDFKISDVSFTPSPIPGLAFGYMGDYLGLDIQGGKAYPIWADNRDGFVMAYSSPIELINRPEPPLEFSAYSDYQTPSGMALNWADPVHYGNGDTLVADAYSIIVTRDGEEVAVVEGGVGEYMDMDLADGQAYAYEIYAKIDTADITSTLATASWIAGGSPIPNPPMDFNIAGNTDEITVEWTSPSRNIDGTPMDDYLGINLYRDGEVIEVFARTTADTGIADSDVYTVDPPGFYTWHITAIDNEDPINESDTSHTIGTPLSLPFDDAFEFEGEPNPALWINTNAEVNDNADGPPTAPYALNLNGKPNGGDTLDLKPLDLSGVAGMHAHLTYAWQPGGTGDKPEEDDSLSVYLLNNLGEWIQVRSYPGTEVHPFETETIIIEDEDAGGGTFLHSQFQLRFTSVGGAGSFPNDNWFIDDVSLNLNATGIENGDAIPQTIAVSRNYPNPFNPSTTIDYQLPQRTDVSLAVYNILGQHVRTLVDGDMTAGYHTALWNGRDDSGAAVASGIYIYRFVTAEFEQSQKMILMK